ncbi:hypothetical protein PENTCL1PPCAC_12117, partial [Pristionchus entomophagus]
SMLLTTVLSLLLIETARAQFGFNFAELVGPAIALATNKGSRVEQAAQVAQGVSYVFLGRPGQEQYQQQQQGGYYGGGQSEFSRLSAPGGFGGAPSNNGPPSSSYFPQSSGSNYGSFGGSSNSFGGSNRPSSSFFGPSSSSIGGTGGLKSSPSSFGDYDSGSFSRKREVSSFGSRAPAPPEVVGGTGGLKSSFVDSSPNRPAPSNSAYPKQRRQSKHAVRHSSPDGNRPHGKASQLGIVRSAMNDFDLLNRGR